MRWNQLNVNKIGRCTDLLQPDLCRERLFKEDELVQVLEEGGHELEWWDTPSPRQKKRHLTNLEHWKLETPEYQIFVTSFF